jgi:AMMECR1 domain-containing protein
MTIEPPLAQAIGNPDGLSEDSLYLIAYRLGRRGEFADPEPAGRWRDWSDATTDRFANRCLPLLIANQSGWVIRAPAAIEVVWSGGSGLDQVSVNGWTETWPCPAHSHFGHGILTWTIPFLFRTPPGINLLARGPANAPKDGAAPLEGVIETDWAVASFTMNWQLTRPGLPVRFDHGEPICMIVPQRRGELERFAPEVRELAESPEVAMPFRDWRRSRREFNAGLGVGREPGLWQKHYFRGTSPSGVIAPDHQTVARLQPFSESRVEPDELLIVPEFATAQETECVRSAFLAAAGAAQSGDANIQATLLARRTEIAARALHELTSPVVATTLADVRQRAIATMESFFDIENGRADYTLFTEMRVGDSHPLHADAERETADGWAPNHTPWRTHVGLLYLNTAGVDHQGGTLRLPGRGREIEPTAGLFVAFPSDRRYIHEVTTILAGARLTMAVWLTDDVSRTEHWGPRRPCSADRLPRQRAAPTPTIDEAQATRLLAFARTAVVDTVRGGPAAESGHRGPHSVNVTVRVDGRLRASMGSEGASWEQAVRRAGARAASDARFGGALDRGELSRICVELWARTGVEVIDADADLGVELDLGLDGVEIRDGARSAYYKPSVALTSRVTRADRLLEKLARKAGLAADAGRRPDVRVSRTSWEHFAQGPGAGAVTSRLRRLRPAQCEPLSVRALQRHVELAAQRLIAVQQPAGHYLYKMHPFKDKREEGIGNLVRQAGCALAIAREADAAIGTARERALVDSASRAIDALVAHAITAEFDSGETLIVAEPSDQGRTWGKLGSLALTLAALQSPVLQRGREQWRGRLTDSIVRWQRPNGSFRCSTDTTADAEDGKLQDFYPGQALMALVEEARCGSAAAEAAVVAAFPYYRRRFRERPTAAFLLWQTTAWGARAQSLRSSEGAATPDARACAEFVWEMADWISPFQLGPADAHPDLVGSFSLDGRLPTFSCGCWVEAITVAAEVASAFAEPERAARYRRAGRLGVDFVRRLQLLPETAYLFPDPASTIGATTHSLSDLSLRCDFDQHTITCLRAAIDTELVVNP